MEEAAWREQLGRMAEDIPNGIIVIDKDGRIAYVNVAAEKILGLKRSEMIGLAYNDPALKITGVQGEPIPEEHRPFVQVMRANGPVFDMEHAHIRPDGTWVVVSVNAMPHRGRSGEILSVVLSVSDVTKRKEAEEALGKSEEKYRTLFETMAQGVVYHDATGKIISANPAARKMLGLTLDQMLGRTSMDFRWRAIHEDGSDFPGETHPAIVALKTGKAVRNVVIGVFNPQEGKYCWININAIPQFIPGEDKPYQIYATFDDITESKRKKELSDALKDINADINSTLDFNEIMQKVVVEATRAIGTELAAIVLREGNHWVARYLYGLPQELLGIRLTDEEGPHMVLAARTKKPVVINDAYHDERVNREMMRSYGFCSVLTIPLMVRENVIGVLVFTCQSVPTPFTDAQVDFAEKLGSSISLALENARLYAVERNIADTLQEALLTVPQKIEGIEFDSLYRSATEATKVGGDFYDIFEIEHGRVGIVVGDVSGKGLEAATLTSLVKNTIKAYAYEDISPAAIMARTNEVARRASALSVFVTVFFGILNTEDGSLIYCSAGHPPALLKKTTLATRLLITSSPAIGAFSNLNFIDDEATLEKGDVLVLYTDGVTEARCDREFFGEERLVSFVRDLTKVSAKVLPSMVFDAVMECTGGRLKDDVVLLAVSYVGR